MDRVTDEEAMQGPPMLSDTECLASGGHDWVERVSSDVVFTYTWHACRRCGRREESSMSSAYRDGL